MPKRQVAVTGIFDRNIKATAPIVVNVGGARSSKSYSILQLFVRLFIEERNKEILIARKTLPSLRITAYKVFVELLQDYGYYSKCTHNKSNLTIKYRSNTVQFLSIDDPEKVKSAEFNYVFLEEANEFTYLDFMTLWLRMSAPTPEHQPNRMYLALNPSEEFSWINQKLVHWDNVKVIKSTYLDNPFLSPVYKKTLEDLKETDPELYQIYALGEYAALSNIIYQNYVIDRTFPIAWQDEFYGLDFGYNNPASLTWVGAKDSEMYLQEIIYQTHLTNPQLIELMDDCKVNKKIPIYADSAEPKSIEDLCKAGYNVLPAIKQVMDGIKSVKSHKLHIHHESTNIIKEIRTHKWRQDKNGNNLDEPVKFNDHACFVAGTLVTTSEGNKPVEDMQIGDKVMTRQGFKHVVASGKTGTRSVMTLTLSDGTTITSTPDHPIWIDGKGFCSLDAIRYGDYIWQLKPSYLTESDSTDTQNLNRVHSEIISDHMRCTSETESRLCTGKYGKAFMERSLPSMISTTSTATLSIILLKILNACQRRNIYQSILKNGMKRIRNRWRSIWIKYAHSQGSGTLQKKVDDGIGITGSKYTDQEHLSEKSVSNAEINSMMYPDTSLLGSAQTNAKQHGGEQAESITKNGYVQHAEPRSQPINMKRLNAVLVVAVQRCNGKQEVYNLTVEDAHEYFANEILVSNCDSIRYGIHTHYAAPKKKKVVAPRGH